MLSILIYGLLAVVRAAPSQADVRDAPIPGATVVPLFWDTQAFPDGPTLRLNGTIQEIRRQLLEINPNYDTDFNRTAVVEKRDEFDGAKYFCLEKWGHPYERGYYSGLDYLRNHRGAPHMQPGPAVCSRVSCGYKTGIWLCNDNPHEMYLSSWRTVADAAEHVWIECQTPTVSIGGQVFHKNNWNVIVSEQDC
ncbi:Uncharacterized protein TCAP_03995 [Tolypocladium capitatum]|uniref:Secreted protein n=1 Tax=Tolypocladium capitatum TaxID=45235 RepID=A0A2K3QEX8_9HYPO|nr:Uncharacterized protein TCAP_03995 [Tolypocladium capitatum]